jgi:hypothetical protein
VLVAFDGLMLDYILKKLVNVFEGIVAVSKKYFSDNATGVADVRPRKNAKKLPVWLQRQKINTSYQTTHLKIGHSDSSPAVHRQAQC